MSLINVTTSGCELAELRPYPSVTSTDGSVGVTSVVGPDGKTTFDLSSTGQFVTEPLYEYRDIWAEESGTTDQNSAEWSFGNGATGYIGLPIDEGWEVEAIYAHFDTYPATARIQIDLMNYGMAIPGPAAANTITSITFSGSTDGNGATNNAYKYEKLPSPVPVPTINGFTVLGFITRGESGNISDARVGVRLRRKVGDVLVASTSGSSQSLTPSSGELVSDNFQDGNGNAPFNLQVRNTTGNPVNWVAVVRDVPYASIPNLAPGNYSLSTEGTGPYTHTFTGTAPLSAYSNITITGGLPTPAGAGSSSGLPELYIG